MDGARLRTQAIKGDGKKQTQRHERSAPTRARLLSAAAHAFAARGFHGTSTRDIAAGADISPTAMYAHHASKEELLYLLAKSGHDRALDVVREAVACTDSPRTQLRQLVYNFAIHHAATHVVSRVANYELAALSPEHLEEIEALRRSITDVFRRVIDAGIQSGDFETANPRLAVSALVSQCVDISRWYHESGIKPEEIAETYSTMALRSLAPVGD